MARAKTTNYSITFTNPGGESLHSLKQIWNRGMAENMLKKIQELPPPARLAVFHQMIKRTKN